MHFIYTSCLIVSIFIARLYRNVENGHQGLVPEFREAFNIPPLKMGISGLALGVLWMS